VQNLHGLVGLLIEFLLPLIYLKIKRRAEIFVIFARFFLLSPKEKSHALQRQEAWLNTHIAQEVI